MSRYHLSFEINLVVKLVEHDVAFTLPATHVAQCLKTLTFIVLIVFLVLLHAVEHLRAEIQQCFPLTGCNTNLLFTPACIHLQRTDPFNEY